MRLSINTVGSVLDLYRTDLAPQRGEAEARAIGRAVFQEQMGWDRTELENRRHTALSESELLRVYLPLTRLRKGEPLQYVLGHTWFMGLELRVAPGVLIPRPETEELVDLIHRSGHIPRSVIDIGTGSGCIALALRKLFPKAEVYGLDVSEEALAIAQGNGAKLGLAVHWVQADVRIAEEPLPAKVDLVVSNPPYIPHSEATTLETHVRDHEPHLALFVTDGDPLEFYRVIARKAWDALVPGGALWFEGHYRHAHAVGAMLSELGFLNVGVQEDLSGSPRFIQAMR